MDKKSKRALIALNGEPVSLDTLKNCCADFVICADGAYNWLRDLCPPNIVVGDLDSISMELFPELDVLEKAKKLEILRFSVDKDFTDGHLAVEYALKQGFNEIILVGASGNRPDHYFANLCLLSLCHSYGVAAAVIGDNFEIKLLTKGKNILATKRNQTLSLVPFGNSLHILRTTGLKYALRDRILDKIHLLGISNETTQDRVEIEIADGEALVFLLA